MSEAKNQITRREILKRGAFVGGAVVWATPVVQTLGMGRAFAATPSDTCIPSWADQKISYLPGKRKDNSAILAGRDNPLNALGPPDSKFVSLGYFGELVVHLAIPYYSGKNGEALLLETSGGTPPYNREQAHVYVSGGASGPWILAGVAHNQNVAGSEKRTELPLDGVSGLPSIVRYVKLHDFTDASLHDDASDGYDVEAVGITCPTAPVPQ